MGSRFYLAAAALLCVSSLVQAETLDFDTGVLENNSGIAAAHVRDVYLQDGWRLRTLRSGSGWHFDLQSPTSIPGDINVFFHDGGANPATEDNILVLERLDGGLFDFVSIDIESRSGSDVRVSAGGVVVDLTAIGTLALPFRGVDVVSFGLITPDLLNSVNTAFDNLIVAASVPIPEPSTFTLIGLLVSWCFVKRWRRDRA